MDEKWKMIGKKWMQIKFEIDNTRMKKVDLNQFKPFLIPLKMKTNLDWKKCI